MVQHADIDHSGLTGVGGADPTKPGTAVDWATSSFTGWSDVGTVNKDIDTTRPGCLYLDSPNNSGIAGIRRTLPGMPDVITARFDMNIIEISNNHSGIMVCEASPGRMVLLGIVNYGGSDTRIGRRYYTTPTTYSSEAVTANLGNLSAVIHGKSIWLRLTATSSTSFTSAYSFEGTHWITLETAFNPAAGTYTDWGYFNDRNSASAGSVKLASPWYDLS